MTNFAPPVFGDWVAKLEARHLADLRVSEITRALRALSSAYVERRHKVAAGATLDTAGKRAAFAVFYAPLHFLATFHAVTALNAAEPVPTAITDLGCGTGAAGAAWAIAAHGLPSVVGIDRHSWAVDEARTTYRQLRLNGQARQGDIARERRFKPGSAVVAAYALNELPDDARKRVESHLIDASRQGVRTLVIEPIARGITPWWDQTADLIVGAGGRADEWKFPVDLPPFLRLLDRAAGLDHHELKLRTLYLPGH